MPFISITDKSTLLVSADDISNGAGAVAGLETHLLQHVVIVWPHAFHAYPHQVIDHIDHNLMPSFCRGKLRGIPGRRLVKSDSRH